MFSEFGKRMKSVNQIPLPNFVPPKRLRQCDTGLGFHALLLKIKEDERFPKVMHFDATQSGRQP